MVAEREGVTFSREAKRGETNKTRLFKARSKVRVPDGMNGLDREDKLVVMFALIEEVGKVENLERAQEFKYFERGGEKVLGKFLTASRGK